MSAQAIHVIDQGLAECRESKLFWRKVAISEYKMRLWYLSLAGLNTVFAITPPYWWMNALNLAIGGWMLKLYLDTPKRLSRAKHQIETWQELERQWLGFLYAVQEGRPYEGGPYGP